MLQCVCVCVCVWVICMHVCLFVCLFVLFCFVLLCCCCRCCRGYTSCTAHDEVRNSSIGAARGLDPTAHRSRGSIIKPRPAHLCDENSTNPFVLSARCLQLNYILPPASFRFSEITILKL